MQQQQWRWQSNDRYYMAMMHRDLLGDLLISCYYGGLNSRLGNTKVYHIHNEAEGQDLIKALHKRRVAHGYHLVEHS